MVEKSAKKERVCLKDEVMCSVIFASLNGNWVQEDAEGSRV